MLPPPTYSRPWTVPNRPHGRPSPGWSTRKSYFPANLPSRPMDVGRCAQGPALRVGPGEPEMAGTVEAHGIGGAVTGVSPVGSQRMGLQELDGRGIGAPQRTGLLQKLQRVGESADRQTRRHQAQAFGADIHGVAEQ